MSAAPPNPTPLTPKPSSPPSAFPEQGTGQDREIVIVSHSNLFYWWPVWAVGFILWLLSQTGGHRMAIVPENTQARTDAEVDGQKRSALVFPEKFKGEIDPPRLHASASKNYAVLWCMVLLLVIVITNVPLRGMSSVVVIMLVVFLSIIFALAEWWQKIFETLNLLDIRINAGGYLFVSSLLFLIWLFTTLVFDRQIYMVFTPGQFKVRTEIGGGEQVYDAVGMTLQKQRSDLFRHWILGLGSGDLIVKTSGAQAHQFEMDNVLFITKKVHQIEEMLKKKSVIESK
jgi:hypothetical protein